MRALLVALACLSLPARAQLFSGESYDPALEFQTIDTPHFQVHFHAGEEALAQRTARYLEHAHELLSPLLDHTPRERTQVKLVDTDDSANGNATPVPYDTIELLAVPPDSRGELNDFEDWLWQLAVHEYTHILHLDTIAGPSEIVNTVFGKLLSANTAWPRWYVEGWAVHVETATSTGGRARSALVDGMLRMQALAGRTPELDVLSSPPLAWPRRSGWYLYGGRFVAWLAQRYGDKALRDISHENARTLIPWMLGRISEQSLGKPFPVLYEEFRAELETQARATVAALGTPTPRARLTHDGNLRRSPRISRDGRTLYTVLVDGADQPRLRALDLASGEERTITLLNGEAALGVLPDDRLLVTQQEQWNQFYGYEDAFVVDPSNGDTTRLTHGARLSEPDVARDGRVVAVRRIGAGRTAIVLAASLDALERGPTQLLWEAPDFEPVASPRFSPDGTRLAFLEHRHGSYDLRVLDLTTGLIDDLTFDGAQDLDPSWSEDGRRVLFTSDRSRIYDIYSVDLTTRVVTRRTKVEGGAFEPLEHAGSLYFLDLGGEGADVSRLDPAAVAGPTPVPPPARPQALAQWARGPDAPTRPYAVSDTVLPTYWLPVLGFGNTGGIFGASLGGFDVLHHFDYTASGWWGYGAQGPGFTASVQANTTWPAFVLSASRSLVAGLPNSPAGYVESNLGARLTATLPLRTWWSASRFDASYGITNLSPYVVGTLRPDGPPVPARGNLATVGLSFGFSNARRFTDAISSELGRRVSADVRYGSAWTGSDFNLLTASASWSEFLRAPWASHHTFAFKLSGGLARGDLQSRQPFYLGGPNLSNVVGDLLSLQSATRLLRGFPAARFAGNAFVLGSLEYRLPLAITELGWGTFPLSLRRLHAAVFCDVGDAPRLDRPSFTPHVGVGAELRAELVFGYLLSSDLRLGYARGLDAAGVDQLLVLLGTHF